MFKVFSGFHSAANGTSRVGEIMVAPTDLILAFGKPGESDGYKVSGEYTFVDEESGAVFTMYDWKMTNLYDEGCQSPEELWSTTTPVIINIGGNREGSVEDFKQLVKNHIAWIKGGGKETELALLGTSIPLIESGEKTLA